MSKTETLYPYTSNQYYGERTVGRSESFVNLCNLVDDKPPISKRPSRVVTPERNKEKYSNEINSNHMFPPPFPNVPSGYETIFGSFPENQHSTSSPFIGSNSLFGTSPLSGNCLYGDKISSCDNSPICGEKTLPRNKKTVNVNVREIKNFLNNHRSTGFEPSLVTKETMLSFVDAKDDPESIFLANIINRVNQYFDTRIVNNTREYIKKFLEQNHNCIATFSTSETITIFKRRFGCECCANIAECTAISALLDDSNDAEVEKNIHSCEKYCYFHKISIERSINNKDLWNLLIHHEFIKNIDLRCGRKESNNASVYFPQGIGVFQNVALKAVSISFT